MTILAESSLQILARAMDGAQRGRASTEAELAKGMSGIFRDLAIAQLLDEELLLPIRCGPRIGYLPTCRFIPASEFFKRK